MPKLPASPGGALRRRAPLSGGRAGSPSRGAPAAGTGGYLRMYTDDSPGLKIGPTVALVLSLSFIGFVILLHIWGKFTR